MVPKINPAGLDVDEVADMNTSATDLDAYDDHDDVCGDYEGNFEDKSIITFI